LAGTFRPTRAIWQAAAKALLVAPMTNAITIAHLSDVHLGPIDGFTPRYWNLKRALGYANWLRNRRHAFLRPALDGIVADLAAHAPDHIAVTGDLTNIGLPQEHINALGWLESLGPPERVSVIPGNHDIYSSLGSDAGCMRWASYMRSDAQGSVHADHGEAFPYVRMVGPVALIGSNSAVPTPPLVASGRLGAGQLARVAAILERLAGPDIFRLLLIHHPPLPGQAKRYRDLEDASAMETVLAGHGAELVIHGHNHRNMLAWCATGAGGKVPVVGAPSASLGQPHKAEPLARYNLYRIAGPPWTIEMTGRGIEHPGGPVVELERRMLR
jgi:3',5'-cyclic AMP phosphodiesterase CpdA